MVASGGNHDAGRHQFVRTRLQLTDALFRGTRASTRGHVVDHSPFAQLLLLVGALVLVDRFMLHVCVTLLSVDRVGGDEVTPTAVSRALAAATSP